MNKLFAFNHPFFLPVWRRWATVAVCAAWMVTEWLTLGTSGTWAWVATAMTIAAAWGLLIDFDAEAATHHFDKK